MVSPRYEPVVGGLVTHVAALATRVASAGHAVEILTQEHRHRGLPAVETVSGVVVRRFAILGGGDRYPQSPELWRHLIERADDYDLVHAHSYHATPALAASLAHCRRLVFTPHFHGSGHTWPVRLAHLPYRLVGQLVFGRADRVVCVS
ncbi:MAG TPA: glycosyltransferase family 4 protein, partial [Acidimicrobiales bacterium]|nr:glycosyltransferase family 4 protein [Acidimicrobiales bacterium]